MKPCDGAASMKRRVAAGMGVGEQSRPGGVPRRGGGRLIHSAASLAMAMLRGHAVYGTNRGHDSIAIFAVDRANGTLTPVNWVSSQGRTPRFFALNPTATFLYPANQDIATIVTFRVNQRNGRLTPTGQIVKIGSSCTIIFARA